MKKLTLAIFMLLGTFSTASAELGINVGVSGMVGVYETSGSEIMTGETNTAKAEELLVPMGSVFIEKSLGFLPGPLSRLSVGYDRVLHDLKTGTQTRNEMTLGALPQSINGARTNVNQKAGATLSNINTLYVTANITDWLYVKYGNTEMDVETTESLDTGSSYGNTSLDGTVIGFGIHLDGPSGLFTRFEYNDTSYDGVTLTSASDATTSVKLNDVDGTSGKISIGKTF